jgi:hypothetical protein
MIWWDGHCDFLEESFGPMVFTLYVRRALGVLDACLLEQSP